MGGWFAAALAAALVLGLLLLALRPRDRASVRNTLLVLGLAALVAVVAVGAMPSPGAQVATEVAVLVVGLVLVRLAALFAFRVNGQQERARLVVEAFQEARRIGGVHPAISAPSACCRPR